MLMRPIITFSFLLLLMMPASARAAVIINEIAWMGNTVSANHEWLELYNNGDSPVSLDGWTIKDGMNLQITLSGIIGALDYAVLERTSEESAPGTAFLIYTGALVNTGATLTLYNSSGGIADQVAGGENWVGVGGDNVTKETAQYTNSGWVTDIATPGALNRNGRVVELVTTSSTTASNSSVKNSSKAKMTSVKSETVRLVTLDTELKLKLDFQTLAYVNQPVNFNVTGGGIGENIINSLNYTWNFGDTNIANGKKVTHAFAYPGTYVVTLRANFARHNQVVRQEITVLPVTFSITRNEMGDIQIHNDAPYDVELSGFTVQGTNNFTFPQDTIIIPRGTITIKASKLGIISKAQTVTLFDQEKSLVASTASLPTLTKNIIETPVAKVISYQAPKVSASSAPTFDFVKPVENVTLIGSTTAVAEIDKPESFTLLSTPEALAADNRVVRAETNQTQSSDNSWTYLALIGLLFIGFIGLLLRPNNSPKE